jgi:hypothetical protein
MRCFAGPLGRPRDALPDLNAAVAALLPAAGLHAAGGSSGLAAAGADPAGAAALLRCRAQARRELGDLPGAVQVGCCGGCLGR